MVSAAASSGESAAQSFVVLQRYMTFPVPCKVADDGKRANIHSRISSGVEHDRRNAKIGNGGEGNKNVAGVSNR